MTSRSQLSPSSAPIDVAVIGGGWAGLAASVQARSQGCSVTLHEMAPSLGGRARSLTPQADGLPSQNAGHRFDNGQHILIGAYTATLALMQRLGVDPDTTLLRQPLTLCDPAGRGLRLPAGHPLLSFARGVGLHRDWPLRDRLALLATATGWLIGGFRCDEQQSVATLTKRLSPRLRQELIEPLCVAALNTPAEEASGQVFLRVLKDALFSGPGASDLLLPRRPLAELLPEPALAWLLRHEVNVQLSSRVTSLQPVDAGWLVNGRRHDRVILACSAQEAARLAQPHAPQWAAQALALRYEPIITVYLHSPGCSLVAPMTTLPVDAPLREPAQFAFDHGALGGPAGVFAFVVSGAAEWVRRGMAVTEAAVMAQADAALVRPTHGSRPSIQVLQSVAEKRATFRCTPGLQRPLPHVAARLYAAGDYITGPYPATLEGAVRSGLAAAQRLMQPA